MDEETLRKMAVQQYLQGKDPISIYCEIGRSKKWFFKWLHRYHSGETDWHRDQSKASRSHPNEIPPATKELIINVRTQLEQHSYAQIGVSAIRWEFKKLGVTPPSDRTINRILKKEGLVKKNSLSGKRGRISLFQGTSKYQSHPSSGSLGSQVHQERWTFLFAQHHRSGQPPSITVSPKKKKRRGCSYELAPLLEDHRYSRLSPGGQRTLFPGKQSLSSILWYRAQALPVDGSRGRLHPDWRTLAQWSRGELQ